MLLPLPRSPRFAARKPSIVIDGYGDITYAHRVPFVRHVPGHPLCFRGREPPFLLWTCTAHFDVPYVSFRAVCPDGTLFWTVNVQPYQPCIVYVGHSIVWPAKAQARWYDPAYDV